MIPYVPTITIDGPSASGKGTVASSIALRLKFHYLDSGALYRLLALAVLREGFSLDDANGIIGLLDTVSISFKEGIPYLNGISEYNAIRDDRVAFAASSIAAIKGVRLALLQKQREYCALPGLVADGRDMGSVVFPNATLKIYLTADVKVRAQRRYCQLLESGCTIEFDVVFSELQSRDYRDLTRTDSPLLIGEGVRVVDSSDMTTTEVINFVLSLWGN